MTYKKITASTDAVFPAGQSVQIYGVRLKAGSDAATARLDEIAVASDTKEFCILSASAALTVDKQDWQGQGLSLRGGLSVTLTGTSPKLFVYYE